MKKNKKIHLFGILLVVITGISVYALKNGVVKGHRVAFENTAGTYTEYTSKSYLDWSVGGIQFYDYFKYTYTTTSRTINTYNDKSYVYSYCGPTPLEYSVQVQSGTQRKTSASVQAAYKIFKLAAAHEVSDSSSKTITVKAQFPGDRKNHTLYQTVKTFIKDGSVSRLAYKKSVSSFKYIWGVYAWNIQYTAYNRYPSGDWSNRDCCETVEKQYGSIMT